MKISDYEIIKELGEGGQGKVYLVYSKDNEKIALKVIPLPLHSDEKEIKNIMEEIKILEYISKPSCNKFTSCYRNHYYSKTDNAILVEMEYIEGTTLEDYANNLRITNKQKLYKHLILIADDILKALKYIHEKNVIHNDIKPQNIMIDKNYNPILIDFDISCITNLLCKYNDKTVKCCKSKGSTLEYAAPELGEMDSTFKSDLWSLGVTLYKSATGKYPFNFINYHPMTVMTTIIMNEPNELKTGNKILDDLVNSLMIKDPNERANLDNAVKIISNK